MDTTIFVVTSKTYLPEGFREGIDPNDKTAIVNKKAKVGFMNMENFQQAVAEIAAVPKLGVHRSVVDWEITTRFFVEDQQTADSLVEVLTAIRARNDVVRDWTYDRLTDSLTVAEIPIEEFEDILIAASESLPVAPDLADTAPSTPAP